MPEARALRAPDYRFGLRLSERGQVVGIGDGIAWMRGLPSACLDELIRFADGSTGLVFQLGRDLLGAIVLAQEHGLTAGMAVQRTLAARSRSAVATNCWVAWSTRWAIRSMAWNRPKLHEFRSSKPPPRRSSNATSSASRSTPACKIVDALIPIGKGQRQLVIGDDGLGKVITGARHVSSDRRPDVLCVLVLIGQPRSAVAGAVEALRQALALDYTVTS